VQQLSVTVSVLYAAIVPSASRQHPEAPHPGGANVNADMGESTSAHGVEVTLAPVSAA
jgi:hypothetical protein